MLGKKCWFRGDCSSQVYSESETYPDVVRVCLGSLDQQAGRGSDCDYLCGARAD